MCACVCLCIELSSYIEQFPRHRKVITAHQRCRVQQPNMAECTRLRLAHGAQSERDQTAGGHPYPRAPRAPASQRESGGTEVMQLTYRTYPNYQTPNTLF